MARSKSDSWTMAGRSPDSCIKRPASFASCTPRSLSGTSCQPVNRFTWNLENLFTGWHDVPLSERGVHEAKEAGRLMQESGLRPAIVHESLLLRAIQTTQLALAEMA